MHYAHKSNYFGHLSLGIGLVFFFLIQEPILAIVVIFFIDFSYDIVVRDQTR